MLNASLGGTPSIASLSYVANNLFYDVQGFQPDIVIIEKAPNERSFSKPPSAEQVKKKLREIIDTTTRLVLHHVAQGCIPVLLCSYFKENNTYSWDPSSERGFIVKAYQEVASRTGTPLINFGKFLADQINESAAGEMIVDKMLLDDCHLSDEGSSVMASYVAESLLSIDSIYLCSNASNMGKTLPRRYPAPALPIIIKPESNDLFSTSLVSASCHKLDLGKTLSVASPCETPWPLIGLFVVSDQASPWLRISANSPLHIQHPNESRVCLFDHMCFFPRVNYVDVSGYGICGNEIEISILASEVDIERAIESFWSSKTFDPAESWAQEKFLKPLLQRKEGNIQLFSRIIGFVFQEKRVEIGGEDDLPRLPGRNSDSESMPDAISTLCDNMTSQCGGFTSDARAIPVCDESSEPVLASKQTHIKNMIRTYSRTFFDPADPDTRRHHVMLEEAKKLISHLHPSTILTVGDNLGRDAGFFKASIPSAFCMASDLDSHNLRTASADGWFDAAHDVDVENIPFPDSSIDVVVAKETFHHWPRPMLGLYEMIRVVKKCALLIEPNDFIRGDSAAPYIEASAYTDSYEKVGNYKYQVSIREILKVCWSLYLPGCAIIGFNDPWRRPFCFDSWLLEKTRLDRLGDDGSRQFNLFAIAIFKDAMDLEGVARDRRVRVYKRPPNPFIHEPG